MMIVSHLSLMYSALSRLVSSMVSPLFFVCQPNNVAILDKDSPSRSNSKPQLSLKPSDDLKDLITFDDVQETNNDEERTETDSSLPRAASIDDIIKVHVEGFSKMAGENAAARGSSSSSE